MKTIFTSRENLNIEQKEGINYLKFTSLEKLYFLQHGFILNQKDEKKINSIDIPELISILSGITEKKFKTIIPRQVHQAKVISLKEKFEEKVKRLEGDALLTDQENIFLVVQVADCLPIYLVNDKTGLLGLAHIGWRGALLGIAEKFINEAFSIFGSVPEDLNLVFGPSIGKCCYKVSDSLAVLIEDKYIEKRGQESYLDLNNLVKDRFAKLGIGPKNIFISDQCTCCGVNPYQSYRRDKEKAFRMIAFIGKIEK